MQIFADLRWQQNGNVKLSHSVEKSNLSKIVKDSTDCLVSNTKFYQREAKQEGSHVLCRALNAATFAFGNIQYSITISEMVLQKVATKKFNSGLQITTLEVNI